MFSLCPIRISAEITARRKQHQAWGRYHVRIKRGDLGKIRAPIQKEPSIFKQLRISPFYGTTPFKYTSGRILKEVGMHYFDLLAASSVNSINSGILVTQEYPKVAVGNFLRRVFASTPYVEAYLDARKLAFIESILIIRRISTLIPTELFIGHIRHTTEQQDYIVIMAENGTLSIPRLDDTGIVLNWDTNPLLTIVNTLLLGTPDMLDKQDLAHLAAVTGFRHNNQREMPLYATPEWAIQNNTTYTTNIQFPMPQPRRNRG